TLASGNQLNIAGTRSPIHLREGSYIKPATSSSLDITSIRLVVYIYVYIFPRDVLTTSSQYLNSTGRLHLQNTRYHITKMPSATTNDHTNGYTNGHRYTIGETNGHSSSTNGLSGPALDLTVLGLNNGASMV